MNTGKRLGSPATAGRADKSWWMDQFMHEVRGRETCKLVEIESAETQTTLRIWPLCLPLSEVGSVCSVKSS